MASSVVVSFSGSASGVLSISSGLSPKSSWPDCISAMLVVLPADAFAFTVNSICTISLKPGAIGPAILIVVELFAVKPAGVKSSTTMF